MRIYLIGYMGSGKSMIGKGLAKKLKLSFIDMDNFIEERNFRSIPKIFAEDGEEGFRNLEQKALAELANFNDVVIATGGGTPCFFNNMELIKNSGRSVYLKGTPRIIAERLKHSKIERPLIKGKNFEQLVSFIDETLTKRENWYKQADVIIEFDHDLSIDEVFKRL